MGKIKKTAFLLYLTFVGGGSALAQESLVIYSNKGDTTPHTVALDGIAKITFDEESLVIHEKEDRTSSFAFTDVRSIKFANLSTGIGMTDTDATDGMRLYYRDGHVGAENRPAGAVGTAVICDISGRAVLTVRRWDGRPVSVTGLDKGVYIFKVNNKAIKFTRS